MSKHTPISYFGNRAAVNRIKVLAQMKKVSMGKLVADAVENTYADELRLIDESLLALNDRLNDQPTNKTNVHRN